MIPGRFARDPAHFAVAASNRPHPDTGPARCGRLRRSWSPVSRPIGRSGPMTAPTVTPELKALLRRVKLGRCLDTLPERLALARTGQMGHAEFLELVLADEVTRRETTSADRRAQRRRARPGDDPGPLGRHRQDHLRPRACGTSCARCASSSPATTP